MAKKKGKKKGKAEKKKKVPAEPTEKDLFLAKIKDLEEELKRESENEKSLKNELEDLQKHYEEEINMKDACVRHLQRKIEEQVQCANNFVEAGLGAQQVLNRQIANMDRQQNFIKRQFRQKKSEMEEKISRLEDIYSQKEKCIMEIKKLAYELDAEKSAKAKIRYKDNKAIAVNLQNKYEKFDHYHQNLLAVAEEVFKWHLQIHNQTQFSENIEIRKKCQQASEALIKAQKNRNILKEREKKQQIEREIAQDSQRLKTTMKRKRLEEVKEFTAHAPKVRAILGPKHENKEEFYKIVDDIQDLTFIIKDQENYLHFLEIKVTELKDINKWLSSVLFRANQVFQRRFSDVLEDYWPESDASVTHQIRIILDVASRFSSSRLTK